jgi:hypothetical protein
MTIEIDLVNQSTVLTDDEVSGAREALEKQANRDVAPAWGTTATSIAFVPKHGKPAPDHWWLVVLDNSDQAGALGYHDLTSTGLPVGKVFAAGDVQQGLSWTVTASHELVEMLVDPWLHLCAVGPDSRVWAYEACDAVEADELGYQIDGVTVSDFCLPAWWEPPRPGVAVDFEGHLSKPLELAKGGYSQYLDAQRGWVQTTAQRAPATGDVAFQRAERGYREDPDTVGQLVAARAPIGSRRERRRSRTLWVPSTV